MSAPIASPRRDSPDGALGALAPLAAAAAAAILHLVPGVAGAQPSPGERGAVVATLGATGELSDRLRSGCGTGAHGSAQIGARRPVRPRMFVEGVVGYGGSLGGNDCLNDPEWFAASQALNGGPLVHGYTAYRRDPDDRPNALTAVRVGTGAGTGWVRVRTSGGVGMLWGTRAPLATATASLAVGPRFARAVLEADGWWYALPVADRTDGYDRTGALVTRSERRRRVGERTLWVRLGFEVPVGARR